MAIGDDRLDYDRVSDNIYALRQGGVIDDTTRQLYDSNRYTAGALFTAITNGSTVNFLLQNPDSSGVTLVATTQRVGSGGSLELTNKKNVDVSGAGTSVVEVNRRTGGADNAVGDASHTATYSGGTAFPAQHSGGGGTSGLRIGAISGGPSFLVDEGDNFVAEATNRSGGESRITISVTWSEIPIEQVDELA